jgi:drug/metabolite transporter (DMT)-like permease
VLQRSTAGQTSATTYVVPAIAILLSWLILGEVPTPLMFVGGALCLLGVLVTRLRRRAVAAAPTTPAVPATEADPASGPGPTR